MQKTRTALLGLCETVRVEFDEVCASNDEGRRVRHVARALCELDGHDPELVVMGYERQPLAVSAKGLVALLQMPIRPQWALYVEEARRAIKVLGNAQA